MDWLAPAVLWVKALYYDRILLREARIDRNLTNLRNYLPNWSVELNRTRFLRLAAQAVGWVEARRDKTDGDNHSPPGRLCARLLRARPDLVPMFPSSTCCYGMSWLCEWLVNSAPARRRTHPKWGDPDRGRNRCHCWGTNVTLRSVGIADPRDAWLAEEGIVSEEPPFHAAPQRIGKHDDYNPALALLRRGDAIGPLD